METIERYEFDRVGYLVIPDVLSAAEVATLSVASEQLAKHAGAHVDLPPRKQSIWGPACHHNTEFGYHAYGASGEAQTLVVEDFFNADPAFDLLVNHAPTMDYVRAIVQGPIRINNSELRVRFPKNSTGAHMGGPVDHKYRYAVTGSGIDAMMVRMVYFLHDVNNDQGPLCVVPASHKSNFAPPYECVIDDEPGMMGLEVTAGDAILFTENLRHGGLTNRSEQVRKTLHVGYGPAWMMSQNVATMDEPQYVLPATLARYDEAQRELFVMKRKGGGISDHDTPQPG